MVGKKGEDHSYFGVQRRRTKRNLMIIIPIVAAVVITISVMASISGPALNGNQMVLHNHVSLKVTSNGQPITVPAHIGMGQMGKPDDPLLYGDHSLDNYGMQGMSPIHTHDDSGTIHVESNAKRDFTLGEFLDIWKGLNVNGKTVQATLNGNPVFDFRNIILKDRDSITLNVS